MSRQQSSTSIAASSAKAAATSSSSSIQVYAPGFRHVLTVPMDAVAHMPPSTMHVTRYVLCANFDAAAPHTSCPMGDRCKFVHADTRRAVRQHIHVNYAWRSLSDVSYDRFEAGEQLHVAAPNSKVPTDLMDSDMVLKTKALQSKRRPLSHCAHYYFNRTCNLGADCQFIHAVFIDPNAKDHQRAPVPSQLGEGRELQLSKKQREARQRDARDHIHDHDDDHHHHHDEEVAATAAPQHQHQRTYGAAAAAPAAQPVRPFVHHAMPTFVRQQAAAQTPSSMYGAEHHRPLAPFGAAVVFEDSSAQFPMALSSASSDAHHTPRGHDSCSDDDHHVCPTAFGKDAASPDLAATKSAAGAFRAPSSCGSFGSSNGIKAASGPRFRHDPYSLSAPRVVSLRSTLRTIA